MELTHAEMQSDNVFVRELEVEKFSKTLKIYQYTVGDVGHVVWDAGITLGKYLDFSRSYKEDSILNKTVIELGSGTGVVGLFAAALGADVILTDLPELMPLLLKNIAANAEVLAGSAKAVSLKWGDHHNFQPVDIILIADCIYYKESISELLQAIFSLSHDQTEILISYEERDDKKELVNMFLEALKKKFKISPIPTSKQHPHFHSDDIHVLQCKKN